MMKSTIAGLMLALTAISALALMLAPGASLAGTAETLQRECASQLNLPESACVCIGAKAEAELDPKQQEMVIAQVQKNDAAATKLRTEMALPEIAEAAQFMMDAPQACAGQ